MPTLDDLQNQFVKGLYSQSDAIMQYIPATNKLAAKQRLQIYQSSIFGIKQKSLQEIYSVCNKLVGDDFFIAMINKYIDLTRSNSPDLAGYGWSLPDFIADFPPAACLPYLSDVARLEWAWHKLFNAPATHKLDFNQLAETYTSYGENIVFHLSSESSLITSPYPIHKIWEMNQDDYMGDDTMTLTEHQFFYLFIWRNELQMHMDVIDAKTFQVLNAIMAEKTVGEIVNEVTQNIPENEFIQILTSIAARQWLAGFAIKNSTY